MTASVVFHLQSIEGGVGSTTCEESCHRLSHHLRFEYFWKMGSDLSVSGWKAIFPAITAFSDCGLVSLVTISSCFSSGTIQVCPAATAPSNKEGAMVNKVGYSR